MNAALHWPPRQLVHDVRDTNPTRQPRNAPPLNLRKSEATPCSPFPHATPRNATPRHTTTRNTTPSYAIPCQPSPSQTRETNSPRHTILPDDTKDKATTRRSKSTSFYISLQYTPSYATPCYSPLQQMPPRCATPRSAMTRRNMTCPPPHPSTPLYGIYTGGHATQHARHDEKLFGR